MRGLGRTLRRLYVRWGAPVMRRMPLDSRWFGPVRRVHRSVRGWAAAHPRHGAYYPVALPAISLGPAPPIVAIPAVPPRVCGNPDGTVAEPFVAVLRDARVATEHLIAIAPDDGTFAELFVHAGRKRFSTPANHALMLRRVRHVAGRFALIPTDRWTTYYHWLIEALPRLYLLERTELASLPLIVPRRLPPAYAESLAMLGYPAERRAPFGLEHWQVDELAVPGLLNRPLTGAPVPLRWMRERLWAAAGVTGAEARRRIYLTRRSAPKRRLLNDDRVADALAAQGFEVVAAETLTFAEQVRMAAAADVIVGPHGSGLANVVLMTPGAALIELVPRAQAMACFWSLATSVSVRYGCVTDAADAADAARTDGLVEFTSADYAIPIDRVVDAVRRIG